MKIAVTMGDAAGVGPEIALRAFAEGDWPTSAVLVGDLRVLRRCNTELSAGVRLCPVDAAGEAAGDGLPVQDLGLLVAENVRVGEVCAATGQAALRYVDWATRATLDGEFDALVTLPMNKEATRLREPSFTGHTGFIAGLCGAGRYCMMLASPQILVTHVSTHVSLREAIEQLGADRIADVIALTRDAAARLGRPDRIAVLGLNPHAGEGGAFGREEIDTIRPAVERMAGGGANVVGPLPPDAVFAKALAGEFGAVVCMYHDQGHIPMKLAGFDDTVNVTLGLPIVRTSVDHGTAFDIAWRGMASTGSFVQACRMAEQLAE